MRLPPATPGSATSKECPSSGTTELVNPDPFAGALLIVALLALAAFMFHEGLSEQVDQLLEAVITRMG